MVQVAIDECDCELAAVMIRHIALRDLVSPALLQTVMRKAESTRAALRGPLEAMACTLVQSGLLGDDPTSEFQACLRMGSEALRDTILDRARPSMAVVGALKELQACTSRQR